MIEISSQAHLHTETSQADAALIDFWAPWCGPCKMMLPNLEALQAKNPALKIVKVNVDNNPDIAKAFNIRSIPTLIFMKKGEIKGTLMGAHPLERLQDLVSS